ncbi:uncharacterized protein UV8b_00042 [Ustilaginoidea virens]|uniref:Rhodopsin domain-containing protein n=1 Tax=Ustilaginoidea virens TaxID=1159556 RepID=A0A8E5MDY9_USTVR|nr:uncharacterized protein UV8b_00042 [Ustilaginoidea virens]QUC15801.1 hypothetical protein UV8b_00042 [Ustilaginoidea virens]
MPGTRDVEAWTWYSFASLFTLCRFLSRTIRLGGGVQFFEPEDFVMVLAFGFYTNLIVWVTIQEKHLHTNILPPTGTEGMSAAEIDDRVYGSKITFLIEESMIMLQMLCKVCMCMLYLKLTSGLKQRQRLVKCLLCYVVSGWAITEVFFFGFWCRPFLNYFRVLDDNTPGCTTSQDHLIMSYVFNITSDLLMLMVPIPMLLTSQLPWKQKATICGIFGLGIFVMLASTLNRYYCFAHPDSILWIYWYVREASTAVIVTNVPHCYALPRKVFHLGAFGSLMSSMPRTRRARKGGGRGHGSGSGEEKHKHRAAAPGRAVGKGQSGFSESTENFTTPAASLSKPASTLQIWQRSEYGIDANKGGDGVAEDTELPLWTGGMGTTTAMVEADRAAAGSRGSKRSNQGHEYGVGVALSTTP